MKEHEQVSSNQTERRDEWEVINDFIVGRWLVSHFMLGVLCEKPQRDKQCHQDSDFNIIFLLHHVTSWRASLRALGSESSPWAVGEVV